MMKVRKRPHPDFLGQKSHPGSHSPKFRTNSSVPATLITRSGFDGSTDSKESRLAGYADADKAKAWGAIQAAQKAAYDAKKRIQWERWGVQVQA